MHSTSVRMMTEVYPYAAHKETIVLAEWLRAEVGSSVTAANIMPHTDRINVFRRIGSRIGVSLTIRYLDGYVSATVIDRNLIPLGGPMASFSVKCSTPEELGAWLDKHYMNARPELL